MKDKDFYTKANRNAWVVRTDLLELPDGSLGRPRAEELPNFGDPELSRAVANGDVIWRLAIFFRIGFDEEQCAKHWFASKESAEAAKAEYTVGSEYAQTDFLKSTSKKFDASDLSIATELSVYGRGEPPYILIYEVLQGAGVQNYHQLSEEVLAWIGDDGKRELSERFGENWSAVAALEYCVKQFDPTSLATLAARVMVADFIAQDSYDSGYASRELEQAHGGAERIAMQSLEARRAAGTGGGEASRKRRLRNLEVVIDEIEKLSGAVGLISEDRIVEQAFEAAKNRESNMPKSRKTLEDYGTALRSEEPFKSRYEAVFRKNA